MPQLYVNPETIKQIKALLGPEEKWTTFCHNAIKERLIARRAQNAQRQQQQ